MSELENVILNLANANGTSGDENEVSELLTKYLSVYAQSGTDKFGNVIGTVKGSGKTFLLDAHMDRIGMIVTAIEDGGFLRVAKCGGMDARVLAAQDVTVWGKKPVYGVITSTPPHLSTAEDAKKAKDFDSILVDVGMSGEEARELISLGDRITVRTPSIKLLNGRISAAALDDRSGCAVILRAVELIFKTENHPNVKVLFSGQEETGGDGAITGSYNVEADECISVDISFADAPGMPSKKCGKLDNGPMIGISPILNYEMSRELEKTAQKNGIPYQFEIMGEATGTNADHIAVSKGGIKTGLISVPLRNMHTGVEVISVEDIENCARLIAAYVNGGVLNA
jgi:putative aminopeptidase FrvX